MEPMDPMDALAYLDQIVMQAPMNRSQHFEGIRATAAIRLALKAPTPSPESTHGS